MTPEEKYELGRKAGLFYSKALGILIKAEASAMPEKIQSLINKIVTFSPMCHDAENAICRFGGKHLPEEILREYAGAVAKAEEFFGAFDMKDYFE